MQSLLAVSGALRSRFHAQARKLDHMLSPFQRPLLWARLISLVHRMIFLDVAVLGTYTCGSSRKVSKAHGKTVGRAPEYVGTVFLLVHISVEGF